jgi:hypothetical protein
LVFILNQPPDIVLQTCPKANLMVNYAFTKWEL